MYMTFLAPLSSTLVNIVCFYLIEKLWYLVLLIVTFNFFMKWKTKSEVMQISGISECGKNGQILTSEMSS